VRDAPIVLRGCRLEALGHALKAVGIMRTLAECAVDDCVDREAEGWWDLEEGCFKLTSVKYGEAGLLAGFYLSCYRPTLLEAPWVKRQESGEEGSEEQEAESRRGGSELRTFRDEGDDRLAEALDSLFLFSRGREVLNPLFQRAGKFGARGVAGHGDIFSNFREAFQKFKKQPGAEPLASLLHGYWRGCRGWKRKGTPFFPDAIKNYNQGVEPVTEDFPFSPLDYVLAVEGALGLRGGVSKGLTAQARPAGGFPFIFESSDTMTDYKGQTVGVSHSVWLPVWVQPTTYAELKAFIQAGQAELRSRPCRFSAEFSRAVSAFGVDAGFAGFQEYRFKLRGTTVPWPATGRYVSTGRRGRVTRGALGELLAPLDAVRWLDQFEFNRKPGSDLHHLRAPILEAMEEAAATERPAELIEVLCQLAELNWRLALSKDLRGKVAGAPRFVPPLRGREWDSALAPMLGDLEYQVARAVASIQGIPRRDSGQFEVEPFLGSLAPLNRLGNRWVLRERGSAQAVWTGTELAFDLARVLWRRCVDSADQPVLALEGSRGAPLSAILAFLRRELDDRKIARLILGLSLVEWAQGRAQSAGEPDSEQVAIAPAYAVLRALVEIGIEKPDQESAERVVRRSPKAIALVCQRTAASAARGVEEALRRLSIAGVPKPPSKAAEGSRAAGRWIISLRAHELTIPRVHAVRLAAAALIPLCRRDRYRVFRAVTVPQAVEEVM